MTAEAHNIDSILIGEMQKAQPTYVEQETDVLRRTSEPEKPSEIKLESPEPTIAPEVKPAEIKDEAKEEVKSDKNLDEYGNTVEKDQKATELKYSDEDLNRIVRERLQRAKANNPQPVEQKPEVKAEPEETWESQLESFIDNRLEQKQREKAEREWQSQEIARQAEFEAKFQSGMSQYSDFHQTMSGRNITDSMLMATRNLNNPAAFLYTAAKAHPQELDRISKMNDPYAQAAEIGRLHERLIKTSSNITKAPNVLSTTTSDMPAPKPKPEPTIDDRIAEHAKTKRR